MKDEYDRVKVAGSTFLVLFCLAVWGIIAKVAIEAFKLGPR